MLCSYWPYSFTFGNDHVYHTNFRRSSQQPPLSGGLIAGTWIHYDNIYKAASPITQKTTAPLSILPEAILLGSISQSPTLSTGLQRTMTRLLLSFV